MAESRATDNRVLVIVPTYNEGATIAEVIERLHAVGGTSLNLLIVDDSSSDGTAEIVRDLRRRFPRTHLIERGSKQGLGTAYMAGFRWAIQNSYDVVVQMDADLSHDPADVPRLTAALDHADLVIGSRYVPGGRVSNWGRLRRALSAVGNLYARFWLGYSVKDSTSGFRAWRASWLKKQDFSLIHSEGYAFQIEMTRKVFRAGGSIVEVPIAFAERFAGKSKMSRAVILEALVGVASWGLVDRFAIVARWYRRFRARTKVPS